MRTITCSTCGTAFDVEEGAVGPAAACPACGACASCGRAESRPPLPLAARIARAGVVVLGSLALGALLALGQRGPRTSPPDATVRATPPEDASQGRHLDAARLAERFERSPPTDIEGWLKLRDEVAALPQEQQRDPALRPLLEGWLATDEAWNDDVAHRLVSDVEFVLSADDENLFMDLREEELPAIATIEDARERRWFPPDASADLAAARDAIKQLRAWMQTRLEDPAARAAAAYRANMEVDTFHGRFDPEVVWQSPFLVFVVGAPRPTDESPETAPYEARRRREIASKVPGILGAVRSEWNRLFGKPLGLSDLMAPFGGRGDYPIGVRSYADGHVVGLWIYDSLASERAVERHMHPGWKVLTTAGGFAAETDPLWSWPTNFDPETDDQLWCRIAHTGARALLYASMRQVNAWRRPQFVEYVCCEGIVSQLESVVLSEDGTWSISPVNAELIREARSVRDLRAAKGLAYPLLDLTDLLGLAGAGESAKVAMMIHGAPEGVGRLVYRQQAWMFLHFMRTADGGMHWPRYLELLRETMHLPKGSRPQAAVDRVFGAGGLADLQQGWPAFVAELLGPAPEARAGQESK